MTSRGAFAIGLVAAGLAAVTLVVAFHHAGAFLVVADPLPPHADAVVVMAGTVPDRALETAELYRLGHATRVIITRERLRRGTVELSVRGVRLPENEDLLRIALVGLGVPASAITTLRRRNLSTVSEARTIARWACRSRVRSLIVVSSRAHTRRVRLLLRRALPRHVALAIQPSRYDGFSARRWWRVRHDAKTVLSEWEKLAHYWIAERWGVRACGGLKEPL